MSNAAPRGQPGEKRVLSLSADFFRIASGRSSERQRDVRWAEVFRPIPSSYENASPPPHLICPIVTPHRAQRRGCARSKHLATASRQRPEVGNRRELERGRSGNGQQCVDTMRLPGPGYQRSNRNPDSAQRRRGPQRHEQQRRHAQSECHGDYDDRADQPIQASRFRRRHRVHLLARNALKSFEWRAHGQLRL